MTGSREINILQTLPNGEPLAPGHALIEITNVASPERDVRIRVFDEARRQYLQADGSFADMAHLLAGDELKYFEDRQSLGIVLGPMLVASIDPGAWVTLEIPELALKQGLFWPELIAGTGGSQFPGTPPGEVVITRHPGSPAPAEESDPNAGNDEPVEAGDGPEQAPDDPGTSDGQTDDGREAASSEIDETDQVGGTREAGPVGEDSEKKDGVNTTFSPGTEGSPGPYVPLGNGPGERERSKESTPQPGNRTTWLLSFGTGLLIGGVLVWLFLQAGLGGLSDTNSDALLAKANTRIEEAERQRAMAEIDLEAMTGERDAAVEDTNRLREGLAEEAKRQIEQVKADRDAAIERAGKAEGELAETKRVLEERAAERDAAVEEVNRLREGLGEEAKRQIGQANADRDTANERAGKAEGELADTKRALEERAAERDAAVEEANRLREGLGEEAKRQIGQAKADRDAAIERAGKAKGELAETKRVLEERAAERDAAVEEANRLREGLDEEAKRQIARAKAERDAANERVGTLDGELADTKRALVDMTVKRDAAVEEAKRPREGADVGSAQKIAQSESQRDEAVQAAEVAKAERDKYAEELELYKSSSFVLQQNACKDAAGLSKLQKNYKGDNLRRSELQELIGLMCTSGVACSDAFRDVLGEADFEKNKLNVISACRF